MKVAMFHYTRGDFSGAAHTLLRLITGLFKQEGDVDITLLVQADCELLHRAQALGVESREISPFSKNKNRIPALFYHPLLCLHIYRELGQHQYEFIWCDNIRSFILAWPGAKLTRTKIIWNVWLGKASLPHRPLNNLALALANQVHVEYKNQPREIFSKACLRLFESKVVLMHSGSDEEVHLRPLNLRQSLRLGPDSLLIVNGASMLPRKRQIDLILAFSGLAKLANELDAYLLIMGDSLPNDPDSFRCKEELVSAALASEVRDRIKFLGWRKDALSVISQADIFATASEMEGLPVAVREAMSVKTAVLATRVNGIPDLITNNETGILFAAGDIESLRRGMARLLTSENDRRCFSEAAYKDLRGRFSLGQYIEDFSVALSKVV